MRRRGTAMPNEKDRIQSYKSCHCRAARQAPPLLQGGSTTWSQMSRYRGAIPSKGWFSGKTLEIIVLEKLLNSLIKWNSTFEIVLKSSQLGTTVARRLKGLNVWKVPEELKRQLWATTAEDIPFTCCKFKRSVSALSEISSDATRTDSTPCGAISALVGQTAPF